MTSEQINDIASYIALAAGIPIFLFTFVYGVGSGWWRSWLGRIFFCSMLSLTFLFGMILARRWFDKFFGYEWVAVFVYSFFFSSFTALLIMLFIERRHRPLEITLLRNTGHIPIIVTVKEGTDHEADS